MNEEVCNERLEGKDDEEERGDTVDYMSRRRYMTSPPTRENDMCSMLKLQTRGSQSA